MPINDFKVLPRYSEISVLSFTFTSNKVFYFSQINVFIAFRLSKIYLQSERKAWFCLAKNFRFFILKNIRFFIQKKEALLEKRYSWDFQRFIFSQKEKHGFICPILSIFCFKMIRLFLQKNELFLQIIAVLEFKKI